MTHAKFLLLLALVIGCAGLSIWVLSLAITAGRLDQSLLFSLAPLVMLAALALQALRRRNDR